MRVSACAHVCLAVQRLVQPVAGRSPVPACPLSLPGPVPSSDPKRQSCEGCACVRGSLLLPVTLAETSLLLTHYGCRPGPGIVGW